MLKKIKCTDTGMVGGSDCKREFEVTDPTHFLMEAKKHYLYDAPHTAESSGNFFFTDKSQFDNEDGKKWAEQVFEHKGEVIKKD